MATEFLAGDVVETPQGRGVVVSTRMAPPSYMHTEALSVRLDRHARRPYYVGTMFLVTDVWPVPQETR